MPYKDPQRQIEKMKERRAKFKKNRVCIRCGRPVSLGKKQCEKCLNTGRIFRRNKTRGNIKKNLCIMCSSPASIKTKEKERTFCVKCYIKGLAYRSTGTSKNWESLLCLLEKQNYKCYYTQRKLILGENASIDHKIPTGRGGSSNINNLCWADTYINKCKLDLTSSEFVSLCKKVIEWTSK